MTQDLLPTSAANSPAWRKAYAMAQQLPSIKSKRSKHKQQALLLTALLVALKGE